MTNSSENSTWPEKDKCKMRAINKALFVKRGKTHRTNRLRKQMAGRHAGSSVEAFTIGTLTEEQVAELLDGIDTLRDF